MSEKNSKVFIKISKFGKGLKRGESKTIQCPICGKKRVLCCSKLNGHLYSECENTDCMRIIQ